MLSEEEKKAIQMLDKFITEHKLFNIKQSDGLEENIRIILNLIEKLQKENEELKQENKRIKYFSSNLFIDDYIPKKVVKDKIKEYKHKNFISMQVIMKHDEDALKIVNVLKELLGDE